ncbi:hypothetical protein ACFLUT_03735 [Chloroflexota bacterium]
MSRTGRRKAQKRARRSGASQSGRPWIWLSIGGLIVAILVLGRLLAPQPEQPEGTLRAVVIDQLAPGDPNPNLRTAVREDMEAFGLEVVEFEGDEVTVGTYRELGDLAPAVLLIRSHSGLLTLESEQEEHITALFTNEPYSRAKYVSEQLGDRVLIVRLGEQDEHLRFGVSPMFIEQSMHGNLSRTVVLIAGCSCLGRTDLAEAFRARGASVVLSWDAPVGLEYLDAATGHLVDCLFEERMTVEGATVSTMAQFGSDPAFESILLYYPVAAGRYTVSELIR